MLLKEGQVRLFVDCSAGWIVKHGRETDRPGLWRTMIVTHRYLGITVRVLMLLWSVSGIVMMYVSFRGLPAESVCRDCRGLSGILATASTLQTFRIANPSAVLKSAAVTHIFGPEPEIGHHQRAKLSH